MNKKPVYKTWIRVNKIIIFSIISLILIVIAVLPINLFIRVFSGILSLPFLYISFMIIYSYYQFSEFGGNFQSKIHTLILDRIKIKENRKILDIGTGSAALTIKLAKQLITSSFIGVDYWGNEWEYSKNICEENSKCEAVDNRTEFIKASASNLPFNDNEFDVIVSCLTFHEVKDESDKTKVLKEALRVLKNDGEFIFLDLFLDEKIFGENNKFFNEINSIGLSEIKIEKLSDIIALPSILLNKKILGNAMIISGRK